MNLETEQAIRTAMARFPSEFGLKGFPNVVFRISFVESYFSGQTLYLYTMRRTTEGNWLSFAKATPEELQEQIVALATPLPMHWLAISRGRQTFKATQPRLEGSFPSRQLAVEKLAEVYELNMQPLVLKRLSTSLVAKVPWQGIIEVVSCDCQDNRHTEEMAQ